jgi:hypothetical protein
VNGEILRVIGLPWNPDTPNGPLSVFLKAASLSSFIPSAPGKNKDKNSLQDGLNINKKGIVCQEKSSTGYGCENPDDPGVGIRLPVLGLMQMKRGKLIRPFTDGLL